MWIPKANGEKRGLGIPTIADRALQALVKMALEPEWEAKFKENSYGFRPGRGCHDAIDAIYLVIKQKSKFVLDADIAGCFDNINHDKLLEKLNTSSNLRKQIKAWLKAGVMDNLILSPTESGTPQGGVISPLLANIALHGMENLVKSYAETLKGNKRDNRIAISVVRYADDFVILHEDEIIVQECKVLISEWLKDIGLELKPSKTKTSHTLYEHEGNKGFDFLGFTIRQFPVGKTHSGRSTHGKQLGFKTIIKPSDSKVKKHLEKVGDVIKEHKSAPQKALIAHLNPIIRGWVNYYSTVCSKETFGYCDSVVYSQLKRWAERRHSKKSKSWVTSKYWHSDNSNGKSRNWVFGVKHEQGYIDMITHSDKAITRHIKVKGNKSPYDGDMIYWATRLGTHPEATTRMATLLKKQKGKCNHCGLYFTDKDKIDVVACKQQGFGLQTKTPCLQATTYSYDVNDRLIEEILGGNLTKYQYDAEGNLTAKVENGQTQAEYEWNAKGELVAVEVTENGQTGRIEFEYDHQGIRVAIKQNGEETRFLIDNNQQQYAQVIEEYQPNETVDKSYVHGIDLISQEDANGRIYYQVDGLGSTRLLTDNNGAIVVEYDYDAYGNLTRKVGDASNNYLFAGEQFDEATDGYYLRARYYDSATGRFNSTDPFEGYNNQPVTLHDYLYAANNPVIYTDPTGQIVLINRAITIGAITGAILAPTFDVVCKLSLGQGGDITVGREFKKFVVGGLLGAASGGIIAYASLSFYTIFWENSVLARLAWNKLAATQTLYKVPKLGLITLSGKIFVLQNCSFLEFVAGGF